MDAKTRPLYGRIFFEFGFACVCFVALKRPAAIVNLKALRPMPPTPTLTPKLDLTWLGCAGWGLDNVGVGLAGLSVDWA